MKTIIRALQFFRPDAVRIAGVCLLLLASTAANMLKPWPLAIILDSVLAGKPLPSWLGRLDDWPVSALLVGLSLSILALHALQSTFSAVQTYGLIAIGLRGLARVRERIFHWLQRLSWRYHQGSSQGDIIYRASWDTYAFQTLFQHGVFAFLNGILSLGMMVAVMAQLNLPLTAAALGTAPLLMIAMRFFGTRMSQKSALAHQADSGVTALVQQGMAALPLVQSYGREFAEENRFRKQASQALQARLSQHGWEVYYLAIVGGLFGLGLALIAWLGAKQVLAGQLTVGTLWVFLAYLGQFYEPLNQLSRVGATLADASAGANRVFEILDAPEEIQDSPHARPVVRKEARVAEDSRSLPPLRLDGSIEFQNVSFGYSQERLVLRSVSFSLPAKQRVAILGPSGAGKSTLLHLLPRFFEPSEGCIRLDGVDLRDLRLKDLRQQIALVMQEPILLPASVAENIAFAKPEASFEEIERAARQAHAHDFIRSLPKGYETIVGEGAARLSTGEKQRINLARAFLKDAPILLLDEPTSALDAESEAAIVESLQRLAQGRTTLVVAHRLSTIRQSDHILILESGRVTAQGSPSELRHLPGYYQRVTSSEKAP